MNEIEITIGEAYEEEPKEIGGKMNEKFGVCTDLIDHAFKQGTPELPQFLQFNERSDLVEVSNFPRMFEEFQLNWNDDFGSLKEKS